MKVAASHAIASLITSAELRSDYVIPDALDPRVCPAVSHAVKKAAIKTRVNRI